MPFLAFPETEGPYKVGQTDVLWLSPAPRPRKLVVRLFYPILKHHALSTASWLPERFGAKCMSYSDAYAKFMWKPGLTGSLVSKLAFTPMMNMITTNTFSQAPLASSAPLHDKFPVLIYSHGLGGTRSCYSTVGVELASYGYFVACPEHSDGSAAINILPDKTVILHRYVPNRAVIPPLQQRIPGGFTSTLIPEVQSRPMTQYELRNSQLEQRVDEMRFIADCLEHVNAGTGGELVPLPEYIQAKGRLDLSRLGAIGHSFGASTSIVTCNRDERFKACVCHDPWLFPMGAETIKSRIRVPTLLQLADTFDMLWPGEGRKVIDGFVLRSKEDKVDVCAMGITGTKHQNFSDFPLLAPDLTSALGVAGTEDPQVALETIHKCDLSFFDHHLNMADEPWSPGPWRCPPEIVPKVTMHEPGHWNEDQDDIRVGLFTNDHSYVPPNITDV